MHLRIEAAWAAWWVKNMHGTRGSIQETFQMWVKLPEKIYG